MYKLSFIHATLTCSLASTLMYCNMIAVPILSSLPKTHCCAMTIHMIETVEAS